MKKCIVFVSTLTVLLVILLLMFYVLSQKSSTVEIDSRSDLPTSSTIETSVNYCRTPECVIATSKMHVNPFKYIDILHFIFINPTETIKF